MCTVSGSKNIWSQGTTWKVRHCTRKRAKLSKRLVTQIMTIGWIQLNIKEMINNTLDRKLALNGPLKFLPWSMGPYNLCWLAACALRLRATRGTRSMVGFTVTQWVTILHQSVCEEKWIWSLRSQRPKVWFTFWCLVVWCIAGKHRAWWLRLVCSCLRNPQSLARPSWKSHQRLELWEKVEAKVIESSLSFNRICNWEAFLSTSQAENCGTLCH